MARSNGQGRYNQQSLMDQHSHDGSASLSYASETSSYNNNNDPPPPPPPRKGAGTSASSGGPERSSGSGTKDQSRSTNTSVSKSRRSGGTSDDRRRHSALDNMSMASSGSESNYSQHSGIPPPPPPGAPPAKVKNSSSKNTKQRSKGNGSGSGNKSRRKDELGRIAEGEVQVDEGGFPVSLEDELGFDLDMDMEQLDMGVANSKSSDIFNFSKSSGGTGSKSKSRDGNGSRSGNGNTRVDLDDDVSNSHLSNLMNKAEEDAWLPSRSIDESVATEVLNYGGDDNDNNNHSHGPSPVTNAPSPFPVEDGSVHSLPSIAISTASENSVAARRRRKAQIAADAPTPNAAATATTSVPLPKPAPVVVEQDPPLELYSESDSDVSTGGDNDKESLKNSSGMEKGTPKKKKKKGFGFGKVKKLIRMGANKSPEKNGRKSISPNKIRISSSADTEKAGAGGRGRSNFLGRLSPGRGRSSTPERKAQVNKTNKRTGRSPSPFRIRNRSRSRSRARNEKKEKSKNNKKEPAPVTKKASSSNNNDNNKRSSEIVVSKEKLAENERKLNESANGDMVQKNHQSQAQAQPQAKSQPQDPMEEIAKAQREQKEHKQREAAAQLAAIKERQEQQQQKQQQAEERKRKAQLAEAEKRHEEAQAQAYANEIAEEKRREIRRQEKREEARLVKEARQLEITPGQDRIIHSDIISGEDESDEVSEMTDPTYKSSHTYKDIERDNSKDKKGRKRMDAVPERHASPDSRSLSPEEASRDSRSRSTQSRSRSPTSRTTASRSRQTNHSRHTSRSNARSKHSSPSKSRNSRPTTSHSRASTTTSRDTSRAESKSKSRSKTNTSRSRARDRARADVSAASGSRYSTNSRSISPTSHGNSRTSKSTQSRSPDSSRYHHSMSYQSGATSTSKASASERSEIGAGDSGWNPDTFTGEENFIASTSASTDLLNNPTPRSADPFDDPFYEEHSEEDEDEMEDELEEMQEQFSFEYDKNTIDSNHSKGRRRNLTKEESGLTFSKEEEDNDGLSYSTPAADSQVTEVRNNISPPRERELENASSRTRRHTKSRLPFQANKSSIGGARNAFLGIDEDSGEVTLIKPAPAQPSALEKKSSGEMGSFSKRVMGKNNPKSHQTPGVKVRSSPMPGMSSKGGYSMNNEVEEEEDIVEKPKKEIKKKNRGFLEDKDPYKPKAKATTKKSSNSSIGSRVRANELYDRRLSPERDRERSTSPFRTRERSVSPSRSASISPSHGRKLSPEKSVYSTTSNHSGSGLYNARSGSKSTSRSPERKSPGRERPAPTHSPSFILDRREKRKQREAELEAKAKSIRSQVKALERGRSDYYAIARSRGRRREQVFEASREFHSKSPTRPKTFSPDKLKRALVDDKDQSPIKALAESPVRSQQNPHDYENQRRRSPIREKDSWFEKPDYNTRSIRALSRERARNNKKAFKAPAVFKTGSTRGVSFQAPDAYSNRTDPVIASVAHIQDPIQRAGAMILSAAAIPIQTEMRRYLAVKYREDRTWAITVIQAYFRRWKAELTRYKYLYCATRIQAAFRGWLLRDTMEDKHYCATQIQKVARGYLATMKVYEDLYNITVVQSIARRNLGIAKAEERYRNIITVQSLWRGKVCREEMKLLHWSAVKIQSHWRTYTARMNYQFDVVDIIIVQSIVRKKLAHNFANTLRLARDHSAATIIQKYWRSYDCTMNYLHSVADVLIVQSVVRRWSAKRFVSQYRSDLHYEMALRIQMKVRSWLSKVRTSKERSARDIQKTWRGFWCYTDYVFTLADIIVVQRTIRAHQACTKVKAMIKKRQDAREEAASIVIQKYWRGYSAQMNMLFTLVHIIIAQSIVRRRIAMIKFKPRILEHRAAIKIQNCWRTFVRKRHFMQTYCATIIQSHTRVFLARNLSEQMRCARRIQSWYRCRATRRGYLYYVSARRIQTLWRGYDARKLADEERWVREYAATTIQKTWRMFYQHSSYCIYMHETKAATNIQSHWRGFWDYSHFVIMRYEACKIQAAFRGYQQRKRLEHQDCAAVVIQAAARTLLAKKMCHMERLFSTMVYAAQLSLSQKMAARKIQEAFRQHNQKLKEKKAALIIERFFIWVRSEVEREIERREKEKMRKRAKQRTKKKKEDDHLLEDVYKSVENTPGRGRARSSKSLNNKPKSAGNRLRNSLKESINASQSERQLRRPQLAVDLDDASDISALTTPTATSPKFRIKKKGYQGSDMDDELEGAWLEAERKQNKNATGYARGPGSGSRPKTRESQKENSSTYTPTLKLSARSLSRTRAEFRRTRVS